MAPEIAGTLCSLWSEENKADDDCTRSNSKPVADAVLEKEKDKPIAQVFDTRFSWDELADAAADVYLGVRGDLAPEGRRCC